MYGSKDNSSLRIKIERGILVKAKALSISGRLLGCILKARLLGYSH